VIGCAIQSHAIGGIQGGPPGPGISTVEAYDPETDTWEKKADIPTPRWGLSTSVVDGKIYAIGGHRRMVPFQVSQQ